MILVSVYAHGPILIYIHPFAKNSVSYKFQLTYLCKRN